MKLSIIIVNYNVRYFLEQCLHSIRKAARGIEAEIIIVDNASVDDSVLMIQNNFPEVRLIESKTNLGFSKAINLGFQCAQGQYILLLNPDTLVEEDCFRSCLEFMDQHAGAGALGVKMYDGSGQYLPESKRGFPGLWASFCKMSGLYKLAPATKWFNPYYLGHLDENETNEVDVLSGAFMMIPAEVYKKLNGLDESYFMYGEDIDLSYRIQKAGLKNYYFPKTAIVHFKGESTSKGSLNYIVMFYKAMTLFAQKHLPQKNKIILLGFLNFVIWLKAIASSLKRAVGKIIYLVIDAAILLFGFLSIKNFWAEYYHGDVYYFDDKVSFWNLSSYALVWVACLFYQGIYEKKFALKDIIIAGIWGFVINLMIYSLLPEQWRASRMLLILSFICMTIYSLASRLIINKWKHDLWTISTKIEKKTLVVGDNTQFERVRSLISSGKHTIHLMHKNHEELRQYNADQWNDYIRINNINELILCEKNLDWKQILQLMIQLKNRIQFKILTEAGEGIVGSSSRNEKGEIYSFELDYNLAQKMYQRQKRLFDVLFAFVLLLFSWILVFIFSDKIRFFKNIFSVLLNKQTWVSYNNHNALKQNLPLIKNGILCPAAEQEYLGSNEWTQQVIHNYAWNYSVWMDLDICLRQFQKLDHEFNGAAHQ